MLNKSSSQKQINSDIRELEKTVSAIRLTAILAKGESRQQLNQLVEELENQLTQIKLKAKIDKKNLKTDIENTLNNLSFKEIETGISEGKTKLKIQKIIADTKKTVQRTPAFLDVDLKGNTLKNQLNTLQSEAEATMNGAQGKSTNILKGLIIGINKISSAFGVAGLAVNNFQKSLKTIQKNDLILTNISKTSNSAKSEMEELGNSAFDTASKFGLLSSDYLTAVQEFNKHGFYGETGKSLGELSLKAQAAGSLNAEAAQNYLLAANSAYRYEGSAKKLSSVLDGQNAIANNHNTNMETMAAATEKAGFAAANAGIKINELSAMVGTISAGTGEEGAAIGTGITSLLEALQNVSSDKIVSTLQKAGASMTETANGADKLRNPIAILKDLAKTYNALDDSNPLKYEITTNIGQGYAEQLAALLKGWQDYENMLTEYSSGKGSAWEDAKQSAQDLSGILNKLSNSWTKLVNSMINPNIWKTGSNLFDNIIQQAAELVPALTPLGTLGLEAGLSTGFKNTGKCRMSVRIS